MHSDCFGTGTNTDRMPSPEDVTVRLSSIAESSAVLAGSVSERLGFDVTQGVPTRR
jgi:hypothetical protein